MDRERNSPECIWTFGGACYSKQMNYDYLFMNTFLPFWI